MRIPTGHPDYSRWIVNAGNPRSETPVDPPALALADVELYDGTRALVEVHVVATARHAGMVCVRQDVDGRDAPWFAWVPSRDVRRR